MSAFGGVLQEQGRGFYVTLELFAILWGSEAAGEPLLPADGQVRYKRRTHDFARRLLADPERMSAAERDQVGGAETEQAIRSLLRGLTVSTPGRRSNDNWRTTHLLPYVGDLIHYEAVMRGEKSNPLVWRNPDNKPTIERNYYRGGGGLAHKILRTDLDEARLAGTRDGFRKLVASSGSALGRVAAALGDKDRASVKEPTGNADKNEQEALVLGTNWEEALRAGVHRILVTARVARSRRVDALLHWVPLCIAMHQLERAHEISGNEGAPQLAISCAPGRSPVRTMAAEHATNAVNSVFMCLDTEARKRGRPELLDKPKPKWRTSPRTFFSTTLGTIGLFNAMTGRRHFTLSASLLEAIVIASVDGELEFNRFCEEILYGRYGMIVDSNSAADAGFLRAADRTAFDRNADALLGTARDLGMIQEFSDATRMIRVNVG